jgi:hypothetical protein
MNHRVARIVISCVFITTCGIWGARGADTQTGPIDPPPTLKDYEALSKLPDLGGVWVPDVHDQARQETENMPPWTPKIDKQIKHLIAEDDAGRPFPIIDHCFPTGMPSYMLITHNAFELLVTPGRITLLGEGDGNRLRRIYTDGRPHPADPDPSFHGHSIGHWEGSTLVVDTVAVFPQAYLAISESVGVPNNGDMHVVERLHLEGTNNNTLLDDLEITAPKVLTKPWKTIRKYYRTRQQKFEILEGVCTQGYFTEAVDKNGNAIFKAEQFHNGVPAGPESKK